MSKDPTKSASPDGYSSGKAKLRLETALSHLEKVLEEKASELKNKESPTAKLEIAKQEIIELKIKNDSIANRLDSAIENLKQLIGDV